MTPHVLHTNDLVCIRVAATLCWISDLQGSLANAEPRIAACRTVAFHSHRKPACSVHGEKQSDVEDLPCFGNLDHLQPSMREARDSAEKPPKTTECNAPMRAHASIAMGSSQTRGM